MSDENRFFRFVWRFNTLLLALLGLALVIGAVCAAIVWVIASNWPHAIEKFAQHEDRAHFQYVYTLHPFGAEAGFHEPSYGEIHYNPAGRVERFALFTVGRRIDTSSNKHGSKLDSLGNTRYDAISVNVLAVDALNGSSHWLFDGFTSSIVGAVSLYSEPVSGITEHNEPQPLAMVFEVASAAPDNTIAGTHAMYFYRPGDMKATKLVSADIFVNSAQIGTDKYFVVFTRGAEYVAATYSVPTFKLLSQAILPELPSQKGIPKSGSPG